MNLNNGFGIIVCILIGWLSVGTGWCDIYTYVDENGVKHFTNVPQQADISYRVYIREPSAVSERHAFENRRLDRYDHLIAEASKRHGVSEHLLKALIRAESNFNPRAVSHKGAMGLMQLMPENVRALRVRDPFDPRENIMGGTRYIKQMINRYREKLSLALAAYNAGPNTVDRYRRIPPIKETQDFVKRVLKYYREYQNG